MRLMNMQINQNKLKTIGKPTYDMKKLILLLFIPFCVIFSSCERDVKLDAEKVIVLIEKTNGKKLQELEDSGLKQEAIELIDILEYYLKDQYEWRKLTEAVKASKLESFLKSSDDFLIYESAKKTTSEIKQELFN